MLKLPKNVDKDFEATLATYLSHNLRAVRQDAATPLYVSVLPFDKRLSEALGFVNLAGHLGQGLEKIASRLDREKRGIELVQKSSRSPVTRRMSRLLLLSNDGTARFYRDAEALLRKHDNRIWGCILDTDSETLGALFGVKKKPTKALLIDDRESLGNFFNFIGKGLTSESI